MTQDSGKKPVPHHKKHIARLQREQQQSRIILYTFFGILAAVILLLVYGWLDINYLQLNRPVAKVGDAEILTRDFEARVRLQRQSLLNQYGQYKQYEQFFGMDFSAQTQQIEAQLAVPESIGQSVLEQMIDEELIRQEAAKRGITVSEEELNETVQAGFDFFPNGTPTPSVTPTEIEYPDNSPEIFKLVTATLQFTATAESTSTATAQPTVDSTATVEPSATPTQTATATVTLEPTVTPTSGPTETPFPTSTPITQEGYEKMLADTDKNLGKLGFDEGYYRSFYENLLLREKLMEAITADVSPTEEQVWARHILVEDEETAKDIIKRLQNGEDFAELARELSADPGSGAQGGDLGWFGKGMMVPEFETAAFALEKSGDITTEPVQSNFGFHIIQLMGKQQRPLSADQYQAAKETAFQEWLTGAREEYAIEVFDLWMQRIPNEPNFISAATEAVAAQQTAQAESLATLEASVTETPKP